MSGPALRGVMTPAMVGVMTPNKLAEGQLVRYVGRGVNIAHGSVGSVRGEHHVLTDCPVVWFPRGTHGPHDTFVITQAATDLEPVEPCLCRETTTGTWYGQGHDVNCLHAR